jgi:hypothetical protein
MGARPLGDALGRVLARPRVAVAIAALHLGAALLSSLPLIFALAPIFDNRPAAATLFDSDNAPWMELLQDHPEVLGSALTAALVGMMIWGFVSWIAAGGILAALASDEESAARGANAIFEACGRHAGAMVRIGAAGMLLRLVPLALAGGGVWLIYFRLEHGADQPSTMWLIAVTIALVALTWSLASVTIDFARGASLLNPTLGGFSALKRGFSTLRRRRGLALRLALYSIVAFGALTVGYQLIAPAGATLLTIVVLWLLRIATALGRATVTTTVLVAAGRAARD